MVRKLSAGPAVEETMPARYATGWQPGSRQTPAEWRQSFRDWLAAPSSPLVALVDALAAMRATRRAEEEAGLRPPRLDLSTAEHLIEVRPGRWITAAGIEEARQLRAAEEQAAAVAKQRAAEYAVSTVPYWDPEAPDAGPEDDDDVPEWAHFDGSLPEQPTTAARSALEAPQVTEVLASVLNPPSTSHRRAAAEQDDLDEARERFRAEGAPCAVCGGVVGYLAGTANPASFALTCDDQPAHRYCVTI